MGADSESRPFPRISSYTNLVGPGFKGGDSSRPKLSVIVMRLSV